MRKIEVKVIEAAQQPAGMMMFLAKLTQRGHNIKCMDDLVSLYTQTMLYDMDNKGDRKYTDNLCAIAALPHGTIKRFSPITIAIVGASRRFLAQARTHQVGITYVSASLQYSDYSGISADDFVVPYAITKYDLEHGFNAAGPLTSLYLMSCEDAMSKYKAIADATDNDTAGYVAPQGMRNILIMQGNHESWAHFVRTRACNRNTVETQYVTMLIWEALLATQSGDDLFTYLGPDCVYGRCREGKMACHNPFRNTDPRELINEKWGLLQ
jgi:thymidylate synthase (FAD)